MLTSVDSMVPASRSEDLGKRQGKARKQVGFLDRLVLGEQACFARPQTDDSACFVRVEQPHRGCSSVQVLLNLALDMARRFGGRDHFDRQVGRVGQCKMSLKGRSVSNTR